MASSSGMESKPWIEKYRPRSLEDLVAHREVTDTVDRLVAKDQLPHLLFYGPPGTGKTSTALAIARRVYGSGWQNMTLELNASDERGIGVVRDQIMAFAGTQRLFSSGFKLIVLDEADAMTGDAQAALRRVIEKYTRNTRFIMICNYVSKIIPALQSRCTRFRFSPLGDSFVADRLGYVLREEAVEGDESGIRAVTRLGRGDLRKCLNILQSTYLSTGKITEEGVYATTGNPLPADLLKIRDWMLQEDFESAYKHIVSLKTEKGLALVDIVREVHPLIMDLQLPPRARCDLLERLGDVEFHLAHGTTERVQLSATVGAFAQARAQILKAAA